MGSVTVQTISNSLYICDNWPRVNCWRATTEILPDPNSEYFGCNSDIPNLDESVIDIFQSCFMDPGGVHFSTYILKNDGVVYARNGYDISNGEWAWVTWLNLPLGAVLGFVGTWIFFFFRWLIKLP
jgi:hypothetical protein